MTYLYEKIEIFNKQNRTFEVTFMKTFTQLRRYEVHRQTDRRQKLQIWTRCSI